MERWEIGWHEVKIERPLGQGSFGWVYMGTWNETAVAIKVLISHGMYAAVCLVHPCAYQLAISTPLNCMQSQWRTEL